MSDVLSGSTSASAKDVADDFAALKSGVAALIIEMKDLVFREGGRLGQNAAETISGSASDIYSGASKLTIRSAEVVSEHVQDWPVSSLVIDFVGGLPSRNSSLAGDAKTASTRSLMRLAPLSRRRALD
jgi:hypothetical protein